MERLTRRWKDNENVYWSQAATEELVQRLAEYEDTGLSPEGIKAMRYRGKWIRATSDYFKSPGPEVAICPNCGYKKRMVNRPEQTEGESKAIWQDFVTYNPFCPHCGAHLGDKGELK